MSSLLAFEETPETDRGRALYEMLLAVHARIRGELAGVERLAAAVVDGLSADGLNQELESLRTNSGLWQFQVSCLRYCRFVHLHHHAEDANFFGELEETNPAIGPVVERLRAEHHAVSGYLDAVEAAARALTDGDSPEARRAVADALEALERPPARAPGVRRAKRRCDRSTAPRPPFLQPTTGGRSQRSPDQGGPRMSTTQAPDRFTTLPDEKTLADTVVALEEHGFSVEVVDDLDAAREAVLARIPEGSSVMTNTSVTLQETGIADAINDGGPYDSARNRMFALDFATQLQEMKAIAGQPDYALGSVHAVTRDGTLVIASASGSQLASYAWGAANVIFVVGAQKLVPSLEAARERIYRAQPETRGRSRVRRLWAEQLRRKDSRDPPGAARPHPRRPDQAAGRVLREEAR